MKPLTRSALLRRAVLPMLIVGLVVAACGGPSVGNAGPLATASPSPAQASGPVVPSASPSSSPQQSTAPSQPTASASAPPSGAPGSSPTTAGTTSFAVYLLSGEKLVPVYRQVPRTVAVARAAMTALLAGPTAAESAGPGAPSTAIPSATQLLNVSVGGGVATVDLSGDFQSGGGSASMFARLAQVTYTLTQFPSVSGVLFRLDGQPVTTFSGEGIVLSGPSTRTDYRSFLPAIFVDRPAWGAPLGNPARVAGLANVFEATFVAEISTSNGKLLARQTVMASCGTGCWGTFDATIPYQVTSTQPGFLTVYDLSAKDGSRENVRSYPVTLTPAS